jgi:hypothetical protein
MTDKHPLSSAIRRGQRDRRPLMALADIHEYMA